MRNTYLLAALTHLVTTNQPCDPAPSTCPVRDAVYFSNRSAAYANCAKFDEALQDAQRVLKLKPGWVKGHARAAAAYMGLELYSEAKEAYEKAVKLEPDDQVRLGAQPAASFRAQWGRRLAGGRAGGNGRPSGSSAAGRELRGPLSCGGSLTAMRVPACM